MPPLTKEEIKQCKEAFDAFDEDRSGTIDLPNLKQILTKMGNPPSDVELHLMMAKVDRDSSQEMNFAEFLSQVAREQSLPKPEDPDLDNREAFEAMGGASDLSEGAKVEKLASFLEEFGLQVDLNEYEPKVNEETGERTLEYDNFVRLLTPPTILKETTKSPTRKGPTRLY